MDRIAREGVRFETAIVQNPVCVPSRTSMKSGLYAHQTGVMAMGKPASTPGRYRARSLTRLPRISSMPGPRPESLRRNVGKAHAFRDDWRLLGDAPRFLDNRGRPTSHLPPEWHRRLLLGGSNQDPSVDDRGTARRSPRPDPDGPAGGPGPGPPAGSGPIAEPLLPARLLSCAARRLFHHSLLFRRSQPNRSAPPDARGDPGKAAIRTGEHPRLQRCPPPEPGKRSGWPGAPTTA